MGSTQGFCLDEGSAISQLVFMLHAALCMVTMLQQWWCSTGKKNRGATQKLGKWKCLLCQVCRPLAARGASHEFCQLNGGIHGQHTGLPLRCRAIPLLDWLHHLFSLPVYPYCQRKTSPKCQLHHHGDQPKVNRISQHKICIYIYDSTRETIQHQNTVGAQLFCTAVLVLQQLVVQKKRGIKYLKCT